MSYKFYKTANLNTGSLPQNYAYVKTNVVNATDGGILFKVMSGEFNAVKNAIYFSGSISTTTSAGLQITQFVNTLSSPNNPFTEIDETEFNAFYSGTIAFFDGLN